MHNADNADDRSNSIFENFPDSCLLHFQSENVDDATVYRGAFQRGVIGSVGNRVSVCLSVLRQKTDVSSHKI